MKNFAEKFPDDEPVSETSPYTEVFGGNRKIVLKKQSLVWLLRKNENKLSSDRLQRVKTDRTSALFNGKKPIKSKKGKNKHHLQIGYLPNKFVRSKRLKKIKHSAK